MSADTPQASFSLKDELFNEATVRQLALELSSVLDTLTVDAFVREVCTAFSQLELKERIEHITDTLERYLADDFTTACQQIVSALPAPLDPTKTDNDFGSFIYAPYGTYVARHGATPQRHQTALATLKAITQRFSMEYAIRTFINTLPDETFSVLEQWSTDDNYHVRRLVSEGTRPLLPWSGRLEVSYERAVPLLTTLHADSTRYVTRSVANHLNDISKKDPELVLQLLQEWQAAKLQQHDELAWMTRHALRTLVKQGHSKALALLGYHSKPAITVAPLTGVSDTVAFGEALTFSCAITATKPELLLVDYVIEFVKASGATKPKVFKLTQLDLVAGETAVVEKRHPFKANATTLKYYSGMHRVSIQINGRLYQSHDFAVTT